MTSTPKTEELSPSQANAALSPLAQCDSFWLHGAGLAGDTWHRLTSGFPRALTPDLPGHGKAAMVYPPRVETYADALMGSVPQGAVLIGHSLGGMVALELAARLKEKVAALVLIEAVPTVRDRFSGRVAANVGAGVFKMLPTSAFGWLSGLGQSPDTRAELRRQIARTDRARIAAALDAAAHYDGRSNLRQIKVPTLVIVGRKNSATHHGAALMAEQIPDADLLKLPGGHMLHTDNPIQLRRAIENLLRTSLPSVV